MTAILIGLVLVGAGCFTIKQILDDIGRIP